MANTHRAKVDCISVDYTYPSEMTAMWRATSQCGKYVDVIVSSDVPHEVIPYIVRRIIPDCQDPEYLEILGKLNTKPNNVHRFLGSAIQELVDALQEDILMERINIVYQNDKVTFSGVSRNLQTDQIETINFEETLGKEITMPMFLKANPNLAHKNVSLTKRDIRKMFVVIKKIVRLFPRVSNKNTPLRGLYISDPLLG